MRGTDVPIPITLVTGFLGSGKTTIWPMCSAHDSFERTCAIINEFGDIGLDHELIEASDDDVILLAKGCLCCTIRGSPGRHPARYPEAPVTRAPGANRPCCG